MEPIEISVPASTYQGRALPALVLSTPGAADTLRIAQICRDPGVQRWTTVPSSYTEADARSFVKDLVVPGWENGEEFTWAIREVGDDDVATLVGMLGVRSRGQGCGDLGFWLAPEARGRGTMHRALEAVVDLVLDPDGPLVLRRLGWSCWIEDGVPNWASWRAVWRLGFVREGLRRGVAVKDGRVMDEWVGSLLAGDLREPRAPWDGPQPTSSAPGGRGHGSAHTIGSSTPLVALDDVGRREGDDPEALVRCFHRVYGLPVQVDGPSLDRSSLHMRMSLIAEEFGELVGAVYGPAARSEIEAAVARAVAADDGARDTVETADALADLVYVIYGMALETGINLAAVLSEVQRSNMSKLGADGRPVYREDGKVLKGPGYFQPDVAGVLGVDLD
ncbi:bifunctional GNAT family N-acetyltransferase/nucleoside triphosphate pyrophosphohydrolase family protein [Actinomyces trachealis]|uniref:bifunctional GNAT family N-acetyltransferase/nucleoside triphosphate pyrophosphohydrolase family protein n=1 Tax=Actinomyces trachealis TaxID=2763540 RepID=UPI001892C0D6|nr:bifunctional GNAT family N-acetyltransferase/nucleoside triphosphate pyrophosphohydrolase family protein [Actinomyces trachealis]